jgi:branched-chain amino acid transport system substrate-binding protein
MCGTMCRMQKRSLVPSAFLALALAACGGAAPSSPPASASAAAASKPAASVAAASASAKPAASGATAGSAGAKPAAPAAAGGPLKIGMLLPYTGPLSQAGIDNQASFDLYLEQTGGTLGGRKVELIKADDQANADVALTKARQLVENDKVAMILGGQATPVCYAVAPYARDQKVPFMAVADCAAQDLTTNPKYASPYLVRTLATILSAVDPAADWAIKAGFKKAIIMTSDFAPGIQFSDLFSSAFIARGGTIVQELHPPLGTADMGPYLTQLTQDADLFALFEPGADGVKMAQQYNSYLGNRKLQLLDLASQMTNDGNRSQLGATINGLVVESAYMEALNTPANQNFLKLYRAKFPPDKPPSQEHAFGWVGIQFLDEALKKVNGDVSDTQKFLNALYSTSIESPRGTVKLDEHHDGVSDTFVYQFEGIGGSAIQKPIATYSQTGQFWDRTPDQLSKFPLGQNKGKWVGMTKDKLGDVITPPKA